MIEIKGCFFVSRQFTSPRPYPKEREKDNENPLKAAPPLVRGG